MANYKHNVGMTPAEAINALVRGAITDPVLGKLHAAFSPQIESAIESRLPTGLRQPIFVRPGEQTVGYVETLPPRKKPVNKPKGKRPGQKKRFGKGIRDYPAMSREEKVKRAQAARQSQDARDGQEDTAMDMVMGPDGVYEVR